MNSDDLKQISQLLDEKLAPIQQTLKDHGKMLNSHGKMLSSHGKMLNSHGKMLSSHGKMLSSHGKLLKTLKNNQDIMLKMLDREQMNQSKRIKRIEEHLRITSSAF